jgi:CelD/BcsL family acetyltransferase involved in cellulose biosynthesis
MTSSAPGRWSVVEYRGREALELLEADWKRLYGAMERRTPFHAFEAHAAYLDHLTAAPERFICLVLTDGRDARAICPLESRVDRALGVPIRVLGTPFGPHWPFSDVICPEDEARRALLPAVTGYLKREQCRERLVVVGPLPQESVLWDGLQGLRPAEYSEHAASAPFVFDCERPFDELMGRLSKHFRKQLRNCGNRLASLPEVRFETADDGGAATPLFEAFLDVEASGWKGERGTRSAIRLQRSRLAFYRDLATSFGDGEGCEINGLFAEGRCIAAEFCMRAGAEYACLKIGYDESYARLSPGHLLHAATLQRCCQDPGIRRYNQLSDAAWLRAWHPDTVALRQVHLALGRWSGPPLIALLHFRFGNGRRLARWVRGTLAAHSARAVRSPGRRSPSET